VLSALNSWLTSSRWPLLEAGVNKIMTRLTEGIDMKQYMDLYTAVHNFCTSQKGMTQSVNLASNNKERGGKNSIPDEQK